MRNKKGQYGVLIVLGLIILAVFTGGIAAWKFNQIFESPIMIVVIFLLALWLISRGKK